MTIDNIIASVAASVQAEQQAQKDFRVWVEKEQAKIDDPKARSYSWVAELITFN